MNELKNDMNHPKHGINEPKNDWQDLQNQWQSYQPDVKQIQRKINWVTWRMISLLLFEVILVVGYIGFHYYSVNDQQVITSFEIWNYFIGIFAVIGLYIDFKLRLPLLRTQGDSTKAILGLYLKRTNMGISLGHWSQLFSWLLLIAFNFWVTFNYFYYPEETRLSSLKFILFGNTLISGCLFGCYWYKNKKQSEYDKLKILWQDYLD